MPSRSVLCCVLLVLLGSLQAAAGRGYAGHYRSTDCSSSEDCPSSSADVTFSHYDYHDFLRGHERKKRSVHSRKRSDALILEQEDFRIADALVLQPHFEDDD